ncbi:hypothetical protein SAMN05444003_1059 [Cognatiyoonia sediminum]|uniref:ABC-type transport auxiliary lipoprotein component domain-containing protein n=1 Tax=Cognatiyoonia sediminum TaxID=1508389 RepID=A0A1M5MXD8_9RHOB|nr:PqiC family protein [Cognatiyoonia sediminum]SHG81569.1 hypothetical protein SAMN05444003_1059 [Cognatiyoonia sediminum]
MMKFLSPLFLAALVACTSAPANRLEFSPVSSELRIRALVGSVMVRTVSLPTYAASEEVAVEISPGVIGTSADILWADDPERAVTLSMTQQLDEILNATVGPEPWPFVGLPDVAVDVRVTQMLAGTDGSFRLSGQYFVGGDGISFRNSSHSFDIVEPLSGEGSQAIANAKARAVLRLSEDIARRLGR